MLNPSHRRPPLKTRSSSEISTQDINHNVRRAQDGDADSRAWLATQYGPLAYNVARQYVDAHEARDLAQDALVKVLVKLDTYSDQWNFKTWVSTIARNTCIDWLRRRRRLAAFEPGPVRCGQPLPDEILADAQTKETVRTALNSLPPMYREVLELHHYQDLKYREIADTLNVPIGTVMNRIFRARKKMARTIERRAA